jgi:hypothetical protein
MARPGLAAGVAAGDCAAGSAVQPRIVWVKGSLDVDYVAARVGSDPVQVVAVLVAKLLPAYRLGRIGASAMVSDRSSWSRG